MILFLFTVVFGKRLVSQYLSSFTNFIANAIRSRLLGSPGKKPSNRTIERRLFDVGLQSYRPARKSNLSPKNIKDRLTFGHKCKQWTSDRWQSVKFSDKSTFTLLCSFCSHVIGPPNQRHKPKYVIPTVKQTPKVMVWGVVSGAGMAGLWMMPKNTTMNGK